MDIQLSVDIDRPIEEVFEATGQDLCEWSVTCVEEELIEETPEGVGTTFRLVTEDRGRRMEFQGVVTRHEPPTVSEVHLVGPAFDLDVLYTFEDLGGRTRVTQESRIRGKGLWRPMVFLMTVFMRKSSCDAQQNELEALKAHCEGRAR